MFVLKNISLIIDILLRNILNIGVSLKSSKALMKFLVFLQIIFEFIYDLFYDLFQILFYYP